MLVALAALGVFGCFFLIGAGLFVTIGGFMGNARVPVAFAAWGGALFLGVLSAVVAYSAVKKKEHDVRAGWNLVPVVVAATDIPENTTVTFDLIAQRVAPEQFVTSSVIKPDSASYIVNQKIRVPVQAGDLLLWSMFEKNKAHLHP